MRLVGATLVRNESDVIEISLRHNLTLLDGVAVVDHGSSDGTLDILYDLATEGLPVFVARDDSAAFDQEAMVNRLVRHVFASSDADWVFPLDADEFLKAEGRAALEALLQDRAAEAMAITLAWQTYVPAFGDTKGTLPGALRVARRVAEERHGLSKVALSRRFAHEPSAVVTKGNHRVRIGGATVPPGSHANVRIAATALAVAHVPIRSAPQFVTKVALGWLSTVAKGLRVPEESFHWREAFEYVRTGRPLTPLQLAAFAANYSVPQAQWWPVDAIGLVDDPFLADVPCMYGRRATVDPLACVLAHVAPLLGGQPAPAAGGTT